MSQLREFLDELYAEYHRPELLSSDPLEFPHRYPDPWDQEAVALVAGLLAYGNVKQIRRSVEEALRRMHACAAGPATFVRELSPASGRKALAGFVHRFNSGSDLVLLLLLLQRSWREHGSLGAHFVSLLEPDAPDFSAALDGLIGEWKGWVAQDRALASLRRSSPSFDYLLTAPREGSIQLCPD